MQTSSPIGHSKYSSFPDDRGHSPITRNTSKNSNHHSQVPTFSDSSRLGSIENALPRPHTESQICDGLDTEQYVHRYLGNTPPRGFNYLNAENLERSPNLYRQINVFRSGSTEDPTYLRYAQTDRYTDPEPEDNLSYECFAQSLEKDLPRLERGSSAPESTHDFAHFSRYPRKPKSLFDGKNVGRDSVYSSRYLQDIFVPSGLGTFHDNARYPHSQTEYKQHIRPDSVNSLQKHMPRDSKYLGLSSLYAYGEQNVHNNLDKIVKNSYPSKYPFMKKEVIIRRDNSRDSTYLPPHLHAESKESTAIKTSRNPMFSRHEMETPKDSQYYMCQYEERESSKVEKKANSLQYPITELNSLKKYVTDSTVSRHYEPIFPSRFEPTSKRNQVSQNTGKYMWFCQYCPKKYKRKGPLCMHEADKHGVYLSPPKKHSCRMCSKRFRQEADLNMHVAVKHGRFGKTERKKTKTAKGGVGYQSLRSNRLMAHKSQFRFECNICQTKFKRERRFKLHFQGNKCNGIGP